MPANLFRLLDPPVPRVAPAPRRPTPDSRLPITYHPRYERFLRRCGIDSAEAALALRGEVVCGHPDRHVCRVELDGGAGRRVVYLKREHVVGRKVKLRNWRAGFGWVSRCEREAATLRRLEAARLPGPQWLAYGTDAAGRAFLLVDEVPGAADLRATLGDGGLSPSDRRALAERVGRTLADLHDAGFGTPELAAKHLLVHPRTLAVTLIDWQSVGPPGVVAAADRLRQLAGLHASLAGDRAPVRDRLRVLWAYRRVWRHGRTTTGVPRFSALARAIMATAGRRAGRSSVRDQRQEAAGSQRLVWLAGEAACVVPALVEHWPTPADGPLFYPDPTDRLTGQEWITFRNGQRGLLVRFKTADPVGRLLAAVRERPWRSPAAVAGRVLFHLARYDVPGPKLLAFGQRPTGRATTDSFVLFEPTADGVPVPVRLTEWTGGEAERRAILAGCGRLLRKLHDAGGRPDFRPTAGPRLVCPRTGEPRVAVGSPFAVRLVKRLTDADRRADLKAVLRLDLPGLSLADRCRVARGYADRAVDKFARKVV
ncbi:MAG: lipopolysaccharide kinase InaA family protein [Gemmataceae bacterium]